MKLKHLVKLELPHIKKVIDDLHCQGLSSGALPQIYRTLFGAVYGDNKDASLTSQSSGCKYPCGCYEKDDIVINGKNQCSCGFRR